MLCFSEIKRGNLVSKKKQIYKDRFSNFSMTTCPLILMNGSSRENGIFIGINCYGQVLWCQVQAQVQGQESWFGLDMFRFLSRLIVSFRDKLAKLGRFVSFGLL